VPLSGSPTKGPPVARSAAAAASAGPLVGLPLSGTVLNESELHKWLLHGTLTLHSIVDQVRHGSSVYFGLWAPHAHAVSLIGSFNRWQPDVLSMQCTANGWWHTALWLPAGAHLYRFWVNDEQHPHGRWLRDPENPNIAESGYCDAHSQLLLDRR
ncbi:MAG: hypothetical protein R6W76_11125, partial [Caldilinea sp.]